MHFPCRKYNNNKVQKCIIHTKDENIVSRWRSRKGGGGFGGSSESSLPMFLLQLTLLTQKVPRMLMTRADLDSGGGGETCIEQLLQQEEVPFFGCAVRPDRPCPVLSTPLSSTHSPVLLRKCTVLWSLDSDSQSSFRFLKSLSSLASFDVLGRRYRTDIFTASSSHCFMQNKHTNRCRCRCSCSYYHYFIYKCAAPLIALLTRPPDPTSH